MTETIHEFGDDVVAHQFRGEEHRLVLCTRPPPQTASDWVQREQICVVGNYSATWDNVEKVP